MPKLNFSIEEIAAGLFCIPQKPFNATEHLPIAAERLDVGKISMEAKVDSVQDINSTNRINLLTKL